MTENQIQGQIVAYCCAVLTKDYRIIAIPNGARRTASGRAANAVPGIFPGAPDLEIIGPGGKVHFMEVKKPNGKLSEAQGEFAMWCCAGGTPWALVRSVDDVRTCLTVWNIPVLQHQIQ